MKTATVIALGNPEAPPAPRAPLLSLCSIPGRMRRWHAWIKEALENDGCAVTVEFVEQRVALPNTLRLLVALEHLLFTKPPDAASDLLDEAEVRTLPLGKEGARYDLDIAPTWWTVRRRFRQQRL